MHVSHRPCTTSLRFLFRVFRSLGLLLAHGIQLFLRHEVLGIDWSNAHVAYLMNGKKAWMHSKYALKFLSLPRPEVRRFFIRNKPGHIHIVKLI